MSTTAPTAPHHQSAGVTRQLTRPTEADVAVLAAVRDYPCVSVFLSTRPASRMSGDERSRLDSLLRQVRTRLHLEGIESAELLRDRLEYAAAILREAPTDQGIALYASATMVEFRHLAVPVEDRQIVDPTFATRDLVRSLQASPDYLLLVLDSEDARLFRSQAGVLRESVDDVFPVMRETDAPRGRGGRPGRRRGNRAARRGERDREQLRAFLRRVDQALQADLAGAPLPIVVMAGERVLSDFLSVGTGPRNFIAMARNAGGRLDPRRLDRVVRPLLAEHLADLEAAARDTMAARMPGRGVLTGLEACWHAAQAERPELLLVEESFAVPARLSPDGMLLHAVTPAERELPGVIDDAVDDLAEVVIARGGQVRFVPDGSLAERVALRVVFPAPRRRRR